MDLSDYQALIPPPNSLQPNFMSWVTDNLQLGIDIQAVLETYTSSFNIETAVGNQLDIIGQILGVTRQVDFPVEGGFDAILDDATYRLVLNAKIILNIWKGTKNEIYAFLQAFLPEYTFIIQDNQNMTMTVIGIGISDDLTGGITFGLDFNSSTIGGLDRGYLEGYSSLLRQLVTNGYFFPKPAGVAINYVFSDNPVFALDSNSGNLLGLDGGYIAI